jgi:hypothetical protein
MQNRKQKMLQEDIHITVLANADPKILASATAKFESAGAHFTCNR